MMRRVICLKIPTVFRMSGSRTSVFLTVHGVNDLLGTLKYITGEEIQIVRYR